jgi:hypothetical protein
MTCCYIAWRKLISMGAHRFDNAASCDHRFASCRFGRTTMRGATRQRRYTSDECFVIVAPFDDDTVTKGLCHPFTSSLNASINPRTCRTWYGLAFPA